MTSSLWVIVIFYLNVYRVEAVIDTDEKTQGQNVVEISRCEVYREVFITKVFIKEVL